MIRRVVPMILLVASGLFAPAHASAQTPISTTQMQLASDTTFQKRVEYAMVQQARVVLTETGIGSAHVARANYAKQVIQFPVEYAARAAPMLVGLTALLSPSATTTVNGNGTVTTDATDGAIFSAVATFWNQLAGIDSGS